MTKLATFITGFSLATVEIVKGYSMTDWREDLKRILMQAGIKDKQTTFLFSDVQIINERMVEDINNILNAGDVPNLYAGNPNFTPKLTQLKPNFTNLSQLIPKITPNLSKLNPTFTPNPKPKTWKPFQQYAD